MKKTFATLLLALAFLSGCNDSQPDPVLLSDGTPQLSARGKTIFRYEELNCQLGFNRSRAEFRMNTDNMSDYVFVTLDHIPSAVGEQVTAEELSWTTASDVEYRKNVILEVLKLEDGIIWLWNSRDQMSLVVRELE
ncbi:MAG: hypothetical protein MJY51_03035 [Bacteroidales bacterium]|nr:hypothetical protein [Bacteroidales bacterium]